MNNPSGLALDDSGNLFVAEFVNNRIRRVDVATHKEQLENPDFTDKKQCTWKTLESSSTRTKGNAVCVYRDIGAKLSGAGEIIAVDQEHIKGTIHMTGTGNGRRMDTDGKLTAK